MSCGLARAPTRRCPGPPPGRRRARRPKRLPRESRRRRRPIFASSVAAVVGRPLQLNGDQGQLLFSGPRQGSADRQIQLAGRGDFRSLAQVPDRHRRRSRRSRPRASDGRTDWNGTRRKSRLARFPSTFSTAPCWFPRRTRPAFSRRPIVRRAPADFGAPDGAGLENDAKSIERERARADAAAAESLRALQARLKGRPEAETSRATRQRFSRATRRRLPRLREGSSPRLLRFADGAGARRALAGRGSTRWSSVPPARIDGAADFISAFASVSVRARPGRERPWSAAAAARFSGGGPDAERI